MTQDPPRLIDSTSGGSLQRLLRAGSSELPDEQQLRALEARLGPILEPPPGGDSGGGNAPDPGSTAATAAGLSVGAKAAIGAGLLAAAIGVAVVPNMSSPAHVPPAASVVAVVPSLPTPTVMTTQTRHAVSTASLAPATRDVAVVTARPSSVPPKASASSKPAATDPVAEARLLQRAQDALAANPAEALSLCGEHAKRFPGGILSQEREVIIIQAMAGMGRLSEAKTRAEQFRRAHPRSAYLRRIENLLEPVR